MRSRCLGTRRSLIEDANLVGQREALAQEPEDCGRAREGTAARRRRHRG
jgi:hypothetical protein